MSDENINWRDEWYRLREDYSSLGRQLQYKDQQIKDLTEIVSSLADILAAAYPDLPIRCEESVEKATKLQQSYQQKYPKP